MRRLVQVGGLVALGMFSSCGDDDEGEELPPEQTLACPGVPRFSAAHEPGFFAYYTRLEAVTDQPEAITGPVADVLVNVGNADGQLVFSRATSYRPVWVTAQGQFDIAHLIDVVGPCDDLGRFDRQNAYAFARVLDQGDESITVGWRYLADVTASSPRALSDSLVHEVFTIYPDGRVEREHRPATDTITQWRDPENRHRETYQLTATGITVESSVPPRVSLTPELPPAAPMVAAAGPAPVLSLAFDEPRAQVSIEGQGEPWRTGLSGRALAFDGYTSVAKVSPAEVPTLGDSFTVSAWLAPGATPWNDATIVGHGDAIAHEAGFALALDSMGRPLLRVSGDAIVGPSALPLHRWSHIAGIHDGRQIRLLVDGIEVASDDASSFVPTNADLSIGLNSSPLAATDAVRWDDEDQFHHFSSIFGFEGLIDEVALFDHALTTEEVADGVAAFAEARNAEPALQPRIVPASPGIAESFGARLEPLAYHDLWDDLWRVERGDDVVVKSDSHPGGIVYWRGTSHGMNLVVDDRTWMTDQSVEVEVFEDDPPVVTLAEHMSDKRTLRSHVRVIENSPARVVVHWRYATADVFDSLIHQRSFVDEMHTIYPNGEVVRHVFFHLASDEGGREFFHDLQVLLAPGVRAEDTVGLTALQYANLDGDVASLTWPIEPEATPPIDPSNIIRIEYRNDWDIFAVAQDGRHFPSGGGNEISPHVQFEGEAFPFAGPWNHWPAAQIPSDGRYATSDDRIAHFALGSAEPQDHGTGSMLYGFTNDEGMRAPIRAARAWIDEARVRDLTGAENLGYDTDERAYQLRASSSTIALTLDGTSSSPVHDPAWVVRDWMGSDTPSVSVDAQSADIRTGIVRDRNGRRALVVFAFVDRDGPLTLRIE